MLHIRLLCLWPFHSKLMICLSLLHYRKLRDCFFSPTWIQRLCKPNSSSAESLSHLLLSVRGEGVEQLSELFMMLLSEIARTCSSTIVLNQLIYSYQIKIINDIFPPIALFCFINQVVINCD